MTRIESGSPYKGAGESGADIGANIINRYGVDGTKVGDPGVETLTTNALWPWPYENQIKSDICTATGLTTGWCGTTKTLTAYTWEYLGNTCPTSICNGGGGDTTAPSTPTGLISTFISSSQINLSWTASPDNVGVTGYKVYRGGVEIATATTTTYINTGLSPSTAYVYNIAAIDAAGNVSNQSFSQNFTTQAAGVPSVTSISGTFTEGAAITITGSDFGLHTDYSPTLSGTLGSAFLDFENGQLTGNGWTIDSAFLPNWRIVTTNTRANSTRYSEKFFNINCGEPGNCRLGGLYLPQTGVPNEWYSTFWFKMPANTQSGKFFRIYGSGTAQNIYLSSGGTDTMIRGFSECTSCGTVDTVWSSPNAFGSTWHLVETFMKESNNTFKVYMDGVLQWERTNWVNNPFGGAGHTWEIGHMIDDPAASGGLDGAYGFDDVYFDYTQARVMLGNASTFADSTIREIQIPTAWAGGSINITANTGAFASGATAYLYVIDSNGNVNTNGFPITIGGGGSSDTQPPTIPTNLSVTTIGSSNITISWTASTDNVGVTSYKVYRNGIQVGTSNSTSFPDIGLTPNTSYSYTIVAVDAAGNASSQSSPVSATTSAAPTLNASLTIAPASGSAPLSGVDLTADFGGTATGNLTYTFYCNRPDQGTNITVPFQGQATNQVLTTYTVQDLCDYPDIGAYPAKVIIERDGLFAQAQVDVIVVTGDTTAPVISAIGANTTNTTATITWTTNEPATSQIEYGFTTSYGQSSTLDNTLTTNHSVVLTGLSQNALYNYRVRSKDSSNNEVISTNRTFNTTGTGVDMTAPAAITNITVSDITDTSAKLTWTAPGDDNNTGTAALFDFRFASFTINENSYGLATQITSAPIPGPNGTQHTYTLIGLTASTTYNVAIKTKDEVLNTANLSNVVEFNTAKQVEGGTGTGGVAPSSGGGGGGGAYYYADTLPPKPITRLQAQGAQAQILLTWENPDDTDWARTIILRKTTGFPTNLSDGTKIYEGINQEFTDSKLSATETYYYSVFAVDQSLNAAPAATIQAVPIAGVNVLNTIGTTPSGFGTTTKTSIGDTVGAGQGGGSGLTITATQLPNLIGPFIIS